MVRQYHWWVGTIDPEDGKPYLIYGAPDRGSDGGEDAERVKGMETLGGLDFELKRLPTRDRGAASAMWKGDRLARGDGLHTSTRRLGHERGIALARRREARRRNRE